MLLGSVQMCGEKITHHEIKDLCDSLESNTIRLLSLRGCKIKDSDFGLLMQSFGKSKSILQLNLNLGVVNSLTRVRHLSQALTKNRSLTSLFLHGCPLGYSGVAVLVQGLCLHPRVVSLDLGDCQLTDSAIQSVCELLPPNGAKRGLLDLTLSANPGITPHGWSKFFIAMAASHSLRNLHIDYNNIMDYGAGCLAVALAATRTVHTVDLEGSGLTELGAQTLLHLVRNYPVSLTSIVLNENSISETTKQDIVRAISENSSMHSSDPEEKTTEEETGSFATTEESTDAETEVLQTSGSACGHVRPSEVKPKLIDSPIKSAQGQSQPPVRVNPMVVAMASQPGELSKSMTVSRPIPGPTNHQRSKSGPTELQRKKDTVKNAQNIDQRVYGQEEEEGEEDSETQTDDETDEVEDADSMKSKNVLTSSYYLEGTSLKNSKGHSVSLLKPTTKQPNNT